MASKAKSPSEKGAKGSRKDSGVKKPVASTALVMSADRATTPASPAAANHPGTGAVGNKEEKIRMAAYQKWEAAGRPDGDGVCFWMEAEKECGCG